MSNKTYYKHNPFEDERKKERRKRKSKFESQYMQRFSYNLELYANVHGNILMASGIWSNMELNKFQCQNNRSKKKMEKHISISQDLETESTSGFFFISLFLFLLPQYRNPCLRSTTQAHFKFVMHKLVLILKPSSSSSSNSNYGLLLPSQAPYNLPTHMIDWCHWLHELRAVSSSGWKST